MSPSTTPVQRPHLSAELHERRERVFLLLAGIFLGSMAMLNIIGITRFIHIGPLALAVGVLPYPLTFLCTDLISELYGRRRANWLVFTGLIVNLVVIGTVWLGQALPPISEAARPEWLPEGSWNPPPWQMLSLTEPVPLPNGAVLEGSGSLFYIIYACTAGAVVASMFAYMAAQFCDVALFHFWKKLTKGKHLWLRNNGSTLVSQLVDSTMVIMITFGGAFFRGEKKFVELLVLIGSGYLFKMTVALLDTLPFYAGVHYLGRYLQIDPRTEHHIDREETTG
ncbi:queuosine precursor transporter [Sulfidibacter corallicola]|uniref:Probable queuosine precursor transporter n=1 Tax=Sulfidibacter corallicola TaxID=2818388 RepID=A0A8A4TJ74_SULCO|nr:queuosine precursor transporter [Sulfidibacter corallicola]QTD49202.1 queuosine precursor transporter [Sulfidibacter corallicola]